MNILFNLFKINFKIKIKSWQLFVGLRYMLDEEKK